VLGIVRKAKVLVVSSGNFLLRNFFDSASTKKLAEVTYLPPEAMTDNTLYVQPTREGKFDLVIFDRCGPSAVSDLPTGNTLFIGFPPPPIRKENLKTVPNPGIKVWDGKHPSLRNLAALYEIEIVESFALAELPPRTPVLMEGERDLALFVAMSRGPYSDLCLTFNLIGDDGRWNTTWPLKPSFPLFLRNVLFGFGNVRDASAEETVRPGQVKPFRLGAVPEIAITKPDGTAKRLPRGNRADFAFTDTDTLGIYDVTWGGEARRFAVNLFDPLESDIAPSASVQIGATKVDAGSPRKSPIDLWKWIVLAGLAIVLVEWYVYNKRVMI
jgi:hypothetical protein